MSALQFGLIPARAGNTASPAGRKNQSRAHPRSRGEHHVALLISQSFKGSSPLARGTQGGVNVTDSLRGLIPARAGNTPRNLAGAGSRRAHPRSRGEHSGKINHALSVTGSSPLARGTLLTLQNFTTTQGLIPARAGNTPPQLVASPQPRAHPRSRGEHTLPRCNLALVLGSSPLARGTRWRYHECGFSWGLIPARAGNTMILFPFGLG